MIRFPRRLLAALALSLPCVPAAAWAPQTRVRMADEAVRFMPASLRLALETHREQLLRGMLGPQTREDEEDHRPEAAGGSLERKVESEALALLAALENPNPFSGVAERFGGLAHYVLDAGFPPGVGGPGADGRYAHFADFCEDRRRRFPLVFYGHEEENLNRDDYRAFAEGIVRRARAEDRELARAYAEAGDPPDAAAFDDRSVPFAVGSLSYSHGVTDLVRIWLAVWRRAGGDMGRTPYLTRKPAEPE